MKTVDFGEQIKNVRAQSGLTQEEMAARLNVTRQAVSNWENGRNLPDIEMLIDISTGFGVSLDQLILGGNDMTDMGRKIVADAGETRRAKINMVSICIGAALLLIGIALLVIKALSVEYVDAQGVLHESFFLLPCGFACIFCGVVVFLVTGIRGVIAAIRAGGKGGAGLIMAGICAGVVIIFVGAFLVLLEANSGRNTALAGAIVAAVGLMAVIVCACLACVKGRRG